MSTNKIQHFPDVPRRLPKQNRSELIYKKIVSSAHKILSEYGRKGLSTTTIEVVSGVKKSTIYHYFPNLDAIVMEAIYLEIQKVKEEASALYTERSNATVKDELLIIIDGLISLYDRIEKLDPDFCQTYLVYIDVWEILVKTSQQENYPEKFLSDVLDRCVDFNSEKATNEQYHMLARLLQLLTWQMLQDNQKYARASDFKKLLINSSVAIIANCLK